MNYGQAGRPPDGGPAGDERSRELAVVRQELRELREELRHSEETIARLVEEYREGVTLVSPDGRVRAWNPGMATISGITPAEAIGQPLWDLQYRLVPDEERTPGRYEHLQRFIRGILSLEDVRWFGTPQQRAIKRRDGARRLVESVIFPITIEGSTAVGSIIRDITDQQEMERRIADVARLVAEAPNPIMRALADGRLSYANEASAPLLQAWGCTPGEMLPAEWAEKVQAALATGEATVVEVTVGERAYALQLSPIPQHGEVNLYGMDITKRRRAEDALRVSEEHFRQAFEQAPIAIALVGQTEDLLQVNQAMVDLVGYPRETLLGLQWHDLVHPEDAARERQLLQRVAAGEMATYRVEERLIASAGDVRWVVVHGALLRTAVDQPMYVLLQVQDITERRLADELTLRMAVAARVAEVEEREHQRMAQELHDRVGQELSALGISLSLLQREAQGRLPPASDARLSDARDLLEQVTASVRNVMTELRPPMLDDYGLLAALRWYAERFGNRTGLATRVLGREPTPRVSSNTAIMLFRIVQEALTNVARHAQATSVEIRLAQRGGALQLTVADNGRGFDPQATISRAAESGWGLRTMAERAAALGAELRVDSHVGAGTRVIISLPWPPGKDALDAAPRHR